MQLLFMHSSQTGVTAKVAKQTFQLNRESFLGQITKMLLILWKMNRTSVLLGSGGGSLSIHQHVYCHGISSVLY